MSITLILVALTGLISYQAIQNPELYGKLLFHPNIIKRNGEWSRFLTHGFIHSRRSWNHLLINMFVLFQIGESVELYFSDFLGPVIGKTSYVLLYLSAIICSSIPSYIKHQDNPGYSAVGASGATSALVFAFILFKPWDWFIFPPLPGVFLAVGYIYYSNYMSKQNIDNIGHDAHMYGAIFGLLFTVGLGFLFSTEMLEYMVGVLMGGPKMPNFM